MFRLELVAEQKMKVSKVQPDEIAKQTIPQS